MDKIFRIGDFTFHLSCEESFPIPSNFLMFEVPDAMPTYCYAFKLVDKLPSPGGRLVTHREDFMVFEQDGWQSRVLGIRGAGFYAVTRETGESGAEVLLLRDAVDMLYSDPVFVSLLALERSFLRENGLILHCAYLKYQGMAILFSAPSGTGKSTQADLWEKYRGARTVNGDRALLECRGGRWLARGWPVCGSSGICENIDTPIYAIVMLSQAKEDSVRRLSPGQAFAAIFPQLTVNRWDPQALRLGMDLAEKLVGSIPVWHLGCTISDNAVRCLEEALFEEGTYRHSLIL